MWLDVLSCGCVLLCFGVDVGVDVDVDCVVVLSCI